MYKTLDQLRADNLNGISHYLNLETTKNIPQIDVGVTINGTLDCIHPITIDKDVFTGHDIMILTGSHDYNLVGEARKVSTTGDAIYIHEGVWLATRCIILAGVTIGAHAVVGAGSVVTHDVPEMALVVGNPAHVTKNLDLIVLKAGIV